MEQKKKKQVCLEELHRKDAAQKVQVEMQTTTINRFRLSMSEEDLSYCFRKAIERVVSDRGFTNISLGPDDNQLSTLLARFLRQEDFHTGFMMWGKSGCGMTTRLKSVKLLTKCAQQLAHELDFKVQLMSAHDLIYPFVNEDVFTELSNTDLLLFDDLGYEQGHGKTSQSAQISIGELLVRRHNAMRPTIISSIFDVDNLGDIYGQRVADIIRESYYLAELPTNFRREIINARRSQNSQDYEYK